MLLGLYKPRDRQLVGIMNKAVIPIQLVQAKNWYQHRIKNAKSERFRAIMKRIYIDMISPLVDAFMPYPVPIETLLKDYATDQGEIEVVGTPKLPKRKKKSDKDDDEDFFEEYAKGEDYDVIDEDLMEEEKQASLDKLEEELHDAAGESFEGPFGGDDEDEAESPFITFRSSIDEDES